MRAIVIGVALFVAAAASAKEAATKAPVGQGRACDAKRCHPGLSCVAHSDGKSTCELVCKDSKSCPEDQRCVRDGAVMDCRPTTDL